jgi:hypothetical protein
MSVLLKAGIRRGDSESRAGRRATISPRPIVQVHLIPENYFFRQLRTTVIGGGTPGLMTRTRY